MNKEAKNLIKKTAKIAGVTCVAAGAVALMTTGAALKALTAGAKYLKDTVQKIVEDTAGEETIIDAEPAEEASLEETAEMPAVEAVIEEESAQTEG